MHNGKAKPGSPRLSATQAREDERGEALRKVQEDDGGGAGVTVCRLGWRNEAQRKPGSVMQNGKAKSGFITAATQPHDDVPATLKCFAVSQRREKIKSCTGSR